MSNQQQQEANNVMELKIYITMGYADALARKGKTEEAHEVMKEALSMIDAMDVSRFISIPRFVGYKFMINYYRKKNNHEEALKYENLLKGFREALHHSLTPSETEKYGGFLRQMRCYAVKNNIDAISLMISGSIIEEKTKKLYIERLSNLDEQLFDNLFRFSKVKITDVERKYIICFAAGIDAKDIGTIFNVIPASVNKVRYRIKKKVANEKSFGMIF